MDSIRKLFKIFRSPALANVFRWSKCVHFHMIWICILNVANVFCSLGMTLFTKEIIDAAVSTQYALIWKNGIILIILGLTVIGISYTLSLLGTYTSAILQNSMQKMLIQSILFKQYSGIKGYHSGELVNRVFSDADEVNDGVLSILPDIVSTIVSFFGAATILVVLDWRFVLLLACAGLAGLIIVILFRKPMKERYKRIQDASDGFVSIVQETFENIRLIKASVSERRILKRIETKQNNLKKEQIRQGRFSAIANNSMGLMYDFSWLFCILWGSTAIYRGELTYGSLAAMIQLIGRVQGPISSAVGIAGSAYRVISAAERLMDLTELPEDENGKLLTDFDEIHISDVSFRYEDNTEDVLHHISCTIRKGEFVALTGISGGGKTSLFQLLLAIYPPRAGKISFLSGNEIVQACRGTRSLFAYVPQGNTLFSGTLRENLTLFTDEATDSEIAEAVETACIEEMVSEIGLEAEIGERGLGLSEGQAQRVAVARALLSKAPILLLDESTSALDEETEARMLKNISNLHNKTCLIVTHRQAALSICHHCLHISNGQVIIQN